MMRFGILEVAGAVLLTTLLSGGVTACSNDSPGGDDATGGASTGGQSPSTGGQTASGGQAASGGALGSGGVTQIPMDCSDVTPCGGDVAGTWNVVSSCLELSGDMDVLLTSLGCPSVPVEGYLVTSGSFVAEAGGSYTDNTHTTGKVSFPLEPSCLSVSSVDVTCDRVGSIFLATGWSTAACDDADGTCRCELTVDQQGGMGAVLPYTELSGFYATTGNTLTVSNATYDYCTSADTLTVTPEMSALRGSITLQREGTTGTGGAPGTGGTDGAGGAVGAGGTDGSGGTASGGADGSGGMDGSGGGPVVSEKPCDIYESAGNSCVAAHSTVRALFAAFDGSLYQVKRGDGMTADIPVKSPGGFADAAAQDAFCAGQPCTIWRVYDQTGNGNFLEAQTPDSTVGGNPGMTAANASAESITVSGQEVYSLFTRPAQAYWNDGSDTGMPLGAEPQGVYMVTSGTHYNGGCCYNYGNAQLDRNYHGGPTMDAVYFGNNTIWGTGAGDGPWVMADMEDGMLSGGTPGAQNPNSMSLPFEFVTAMEKNDGTTNFALKGADATQPTLHTMWNGPLPGSKRPMQKEGAVILGAGGDCCYSNNNASEGTFYEGAIVAGYPSDETDEAIHANVVDAGYGE